MCTPLENIPKPASLLTVGAATKLYLGLAAFSIVGILFCRYSRRDPGLIAPAFAGFTLVIGAVAVFRSISLNGERAVFGAFMRLFALGMAVELIGAGTGFPFGRYTYTQNWKPVVLVPQLGVFPVLVPLAWCLMVGASTMVAVRIGAGKLPSAGLALLAGLIAATVDLLMEPAMAAFRLDYWRWLPPGPLPGGASLLNPLGWFLTAVAGALILLAAGAGHAPRRPDAIYILAAHLALVTVAGFLK